MEGTSGQPGHDHMLQGGRVRLSGHGLILGGPVGVADWWSSHPVYTSLWQTWGWAPVEALRLVLLLTLASAQCG